MRSSVESWSDLPFVVLDVKLSAVAGVWIYKTDTVEGYFKESKNQNFALDGSDSRMLAVKINRKLLRRERVWLDRVDNEWLFSLVERHIEFLQPEDVPF